MQRSVSYLLLFIFLLSTIGIYVIYHAGENILEAKAERHIRLLHSKDQLIKIKGSKSNLDKMAWEKPGKEFLYEGNLYDVVIIEYESDGLPVFYCFADHEETSLEVRMEKVLGRFAKNKHTGNPDTLTKLLKLECTVPGLHSFVIPDEIKEYYSSYSANYPEPLIETGTPPPDLA